MPTAITTTRDACCLIHEITNPPTATLDDILAKIRMVVDVWPAEIREMRLQETIAFAGLTDAVRLLEEAKA